ncbi:MAG: IS200/IS605 family transposase [Chloroflexi bacterium]|nr:IS200/IS605 family transposase [Chloroflexota bacterium]
MKRRYAFAKLFYHFVWATKNRRPLLTPSVEARLLPYIGYKCKELGYVLYAVNAAENHLHVLVSLPPAVAPAEAAKNLKGASSHYINKESGLNETLYWQDGYGVVTLRESETPGVVGYIQRQKEHHHLNHLSVILEQTESEAIEPAQQVSQT